MATQKKSLIDPLYQKYTKSVIRALGSTDFYEYFMDCVARAETEIQFSNRKMIKTVDLSWVDAVEETLNAFQTITSSPRNVITEEELIVNVANAKKAGSMVVNTRRFSYRPMESSRYFCISLLGRTSPSSGSNFSTREAC